MTDMEDSLLSVSSGNVCFWKSQGSPKQWDTKGHCKKDKIVLKDVWVSASSVNVLQEKHLQKGHLHHLTTSEIDLRRHREN